MNPEIIEIKNNEKGLNLLNTFISKLCDSSNKFRYYKTRDVSVISNHEFTLIMKINDVPVAYGHVDKENDIYWLGIAVIPDFQGKGLGMRMMEEIINRAKKRKINIIHLSVDKDNSSAISLYINFGFKIEEEKEKIYIFKKVMD